MAKHMANYSLTLPIKYPSTATIRAQPTSPARHYHHCTYVSHFKFPTQHTSTHPKRYSDQSIPGPSPNIFLPSWYDKRPTFSPHTVSCLSQSPRHAADITAALSNPVCSQPLPPYAAATHLAFPTPCSVQLRPSLLPRGGGGQTGASCGWGEGKGPACWKWRAEAKQCPARPGQGAGLGFVRPGREAGQEPTCPAWGEGVWQGPACP